ncbi:MAG: nuclear pore complex subunit [Bacteroidia bacterium]|nr:MAG: nuclear pore complex subunit [Bacteroidia bacterium]
MLDPLILEKTKNSPEIILNQSTGIFKIAGRSIVENPGKFYDPIYDWIKKYCMQPLAHTDFVFDLEYFNSSSARQVMEIIMLLEGIKKQKGKTVRILWMYEEGDLMAKERGEEMQLVAELDFALQSYPSEGDDEDFEI